jgi:hypothetical protein
VEQQADQRHRPDRPAAGGGRHGGAWYEFDVTGYLKQQKQAGATVVNLAVKATTFTTPFVIFASDEAAANRPELRVAQQGGAVPPADLTPPTAAVAQVTPPPDDGRRRAERHLQRGGNGFDLSDLTLTRSGAAT